MSTSPAVVGSGKMSEEHNAQPDPAQIRAWYDSTLEQRLRDYVYGNDRIRAAVDLVDSALDPKAGRLLEVGCGLGISTVELHRRRPELVVHGVDISPRTIEAARRLFGGERLIFDVGDLHEVPRLAPYDAITLLDVYEHIPRGSWPAFNAVLAQALAPGGTVVLTTPSPQYQEYLARHNPGALQIVDETVRLEDFGALAADLGGAVTYYQFTSVWKRCDYCHVVIRRRPAVEPLRLSGGRRPLWSRFRSRLTAWRSSGAARRAARRRRAEVLGRLGIPVRPREGTR